MQEMIHRDTANKKAFEDFQTHTGKALEKLPNLETDVSYLQRQIPNNLEERLKDLEE